MEKLNFGKKIEDKSKRERGMMIRLAEKTKKYAAVLGALGILGGMAQTAEAQPKNIKESKKIEFVVKEAKKAPNKEIKFFEAKPEIDKVEGRKAKLSASTIIIDNIEPSALKSGKKDIYEIKGLFVKGEFLDREFLEKPEEYQKYQMHASGYYNPSKNPLGRAEEQVSPSKFGGKYNMMVDKVRTQEKNLWDETQVVEAFKEIGRENSPEAKMAQEFLKSDLAKFHQNFSDVAIDETVIKEALKTTIILNH